MTIAVLKSNVRASTGYFAFETPRDPEEGMSPISRWLSYSYTYEDLSSSIVAFHVPPGSMVLRVAHRVEEAFTGVTAVIVGHVGGDVDGWITTGKIAATVAGDFTLDETAAHVAVGMYYPDGDTIDLAHTGIALAGSGHIHIEVISYAETLAAE